MSSQNAVKSSNTPLTLEKLPVYYQIILSELDSKNQDKISEKIKQYTRIQGKEDQKVVYYTHSTKKGVFTGVSALADVLLDLRAEDEYFRSKPLTRYLTFKFSLQLNFISKWHNIKIIEESEQDFYLYFNALNLVDEKKYQQAILTLEEVLVHYSIMDAKITPSEALFLIDCYDLYILCFILLNNFNKAQFELSQMNFLVERLTNNKDVYLSVLYLAKHKELLVGILKDDNPKIHTILRGFYNNKKDVKDLYTLGMFISLLALYNLKLQNYNKIEEYLLEAGQIFSQLGSERHVTDIYYNLLAMKLQQGNISGATSLYEEHNNIFTSSKDVVSSLKFAILFCEIYLTQNDIAKSLNQIQWIITNKEHLYKIREIDYWILLHSLAERHDFNELREIANDKIEELFLKGSINQNLIYIYNVRKVTLVDYSRGNFDKASSKLVMEKDKLVNMQIIGFHFELNLDLMRIYLKQYEFSKHKSIYDKIMKLYDDLTVYVNSTKSIEASIFLRQAKIFFLLATNDLNEAEKYIVELLSSLDDQKSKNDFIQSIYQSMIKLRDNLDEYKQNKYLMLISELNKYDLRETIPSFDIFVPSNNATIEEIWRNIYIRQSLIAITILRIQRLNKFDLQGLNIYRIPGLMRSYE